MNLSTTPLSQMSSLRQGWLDLMNLLTDTSSEFIVEDNGPLTDSLDHLLFAVQDPVDIAIQAIMRNRLIFEIS